MKRPGFSFLKDRSQFAIHITPIDSIICKAIRRMSGGLQEAIILRYTIWNQHFAI